MKNNTKEILSASVLIILLVTLIHPFIMWMPSMVHLLILTLAVAAFGFFAVFVVREQAQDERDVIHRMNAGRAAFLAGSAVLIIAIIIQGVYKNVDIWLVISLVTMVLVKLGVRLYSDIHS